MFKPKRFYTFPKASYLFQTLYEGDGTIELTIDKAKDRITGFKYVQPIKYLRASRFSSPLNRVEPKVIKENETEVIYEAYLINECVTLHDLPTDFKPSYPKDVPLETFVFLTPAEFTSMVALNCLFDMVHMPEEITSAFCPTGDVDALSLIINELNDKATSPIFQFAENNPHCKSAIEKLSPHVEKQNHRHRAGWNGQDVKMYFTLENILDVAQAFMGDKVGVTITDVKPTVDVIEKKIFNQAGFDRRR